MPNACTAAIAFSAATFAEYGVDLRLPLNPDDPLLAHPSTCPCKSVMVTIVLFSPAKMHARALGILRLTFFLLRGASAEADAVGVTFDGGVSAIDRAWVEEDYVLVRVTRPERPVLRLPRRVRALRRDV